MSDPSSIETPEALAKTRGPLRKIVLLTSLIAVGAVSFHYIRLSLGTEKTDDAYITGHVHRISADVGGNLLSVLAQDNQEVKQGDLLAKIDPLEFEIMEKQAQAALDQSKAKAAQAEANLTQVKASLQQADAAVASASAEILERQAVLDLARITFQRNEYLQRGEMRAVSKADFDQARSDVSRAEAALSGSNAKLASAVAAKEANVAAICVADAAIASAQADTAAREAGILETRRQRDLTSVSAPVSGRIGNRNAEAGNRVQVGQPLFALVEDDYWIVGNFKETQLGKMREGQSVDITIDALGGRHFKGHVQSIAPSTGAQFALLPPDNATGNFTKIVQRVPVKILFDAESIKDVKDELRPGLSTVVRVKL